MITAQRTARINTTPEAYLAFVMDVRHYAEVDDKVGNIFWVRTDGDATRFRFRPLLPGLSLPAVPIISQMRLTPGSHIDVELPRLPQNFAGRWFSHFQARFTVIPRDDVIEVTRMIRFHFNPLVRRLLEPTLQTTLPTSVSRELRLTKERLESGRVE